MGGLEVEELRPVAPPFSKIVVGEIKEAVQHPNADRLRVCQVDAGQGALLNIVCGAPNARVGIKVPLRAGRRRTAAGRGRQALPDQAGQAARRREPGHAVLGARAQAERRPRRPARTGRRCADRAPTCARCSSSTTRCSRSSSRRTWRMRLSVYGVARELSALTGAPLEEARSSRRSSRRTTTSCRSRSRRPICAAASRAASCAT